MNSIKNLWPSLKFQCLAIQLRYQLVLSKRRVTLSFYSHISVCKPIAHKNLSQLFQGGNCQCIQSKVTTDKNLNTLSINKLTGLKEINQ